MILPLIIQQHLAPLTDLCQQYRVDKLYVFGSVVTERFDTKNSDLDFIAVLEPLPPLEKGENLINLWNALEYLFQRKVDLLTEQPIKNPYFRRNVENTKQLIYDRRSKKISV